MALGYDGSGRVPASLLAGRLGIYEKPVFNPEEHALEGVAQQEVHFRHNGGNRQQERMIKDKRRSLDRAVWYSYQAAEIKHAGDMSKPVRALINPNQVKQDYDDKILSVGFEHEFKCGDVFEWIGTNSHWLIYLQDLTELAYFRGNVRRCSYSIVWEDEEGKHEAYVALRGPNQNSINSSISHGIRIDSPNYTLNLLIPKNEATLKYFARYTKFYLQGDNTCWQVEAIDKFSSPGIIEVAATEYYANNIEDDIANGIVGGLIPEVENPNNAEVDATIIGDTFIKVKKTYTYTFRGRAINEWKVDSKYPVILEVSETDPRVVAVKWDNTFSGQFELQYGNFTKTIVVESLF